MTPFLIKDGADVENNGGGWADSEGGNLLPTALLFIREIAIGAECFT